MLTFSPTLTRGGILKMANTDPAVPIMLLKSYSKHLLTMFFELNLKLTSMNLALFSKFPDLKEEYEKFYQEEKKRVEKSSQGAAVSSTLQAIDKLLETLQKLSGAEKA
jgi:hypothetical protein